MGADFDGYAGWAHWDLPASGIAGIHGSGLHTVYVDPLPAIGAVTFPIGTRIVKTPTGATDPMFAMVKRGAGFNSTGAVDWEWFQLKRTPAGIAVLWRGDGPPDGGAGYGGAGFTCNNCHAAAKKNDWVQAGPLRLPWTGGTP